MFQMWLNVTRFCGTSLVSYCASVSAKILFALFYMSPRSSSSHCQSCETSFALFSPSIFTIL